MSYKLDKLTKRYRKRIEKRIESILPSITPDGPKQIHYWPLPFWLRDRRAVIEILEDRKRGIGPESDDWHWTDQKIREIERISKTQIIGILGLILTAGGLIIGIFAL